MRKILPSIALVVCAGLRGQSTIADDTFADGDRTSQNLPASLAWYQNTGTSSNLSVKNGALDVVVGNDVRTVWAYFPAVTLSVGDSVTLSLDFSFTSSADNGFRLALCYTNGVTPLIADTRAGPTGNYLGYLMSSGGITNRNVIYKRDGPFASNPTSSLLDSLGSGSTTIWSSHLSSSALGAGPAAANTPYNEVLKITRTGADSVTIAATYSGAGLSSAGNMTVTDPTGAVTRFDTIGIDFISNSLAGDMIVTRANLTVTTAPVFASSPLPRGVMAGAPALFTATAQASPTPAYQWQRKAAGSTVWTNLTETPPYSGVTSSALLVASVSSNMDGDQFRAVATNTAGGTISDPATLNIVAAAAAGRITNLSIRTSIAASGDSFTMGYSIGGDGTSGTKPLVIRAAGPSLGVLGVPGTLDDPTLDFYAGPTKTGSNNDWGGSASLSAAMAAVGAFPFSSGTSKDAAALATLPSGGNSVIVSANGPGTGEVLAEIYDSTSGPTLSATTPRLINVSVRKAIGAGGLTAGFYINGSSAKPVLIRAIGPSLAPFGVQGVLGDPQLTVFNSAGTTVAQNNDWGGDAALTRAFSLTGAFALSPTSKDAAVVVTLPTGGYTVQASGVGGTTGTALIEVYELP